MVITQEISCYRNASGEVTQGAEDNLVRVTNIFEMKRDEELEWKVDLFQRQEGIGLLA